VERTFEGLSILGLEDEVGVEIVGSLRPVTELSRGDAMLVIMGSVSTCRLETIEGLRSC
jgi:hypothetical protein